MSGLKITCIICTDEFASTDYIHSTGCGHIFHSRCIQKWQWRSSSCPQCRTEIRTIQMIFFNFENADADTPTASKAGCDLKIKLESALDNINDLKAQSELVEKNFFLLQAQFTSEHDLRKRIELRYKMLQEENDRLSMENEKKSKELAALNATKIFSLHDNLPRSKPGVVNSSSGINITTTNVSANTRSASKRTAVKKSCPENKRKSIRRRL